MLYEQVKGGRKPKGNQLLWMILAVCLVLLGIAIALILWSCRYQLRYRAFVSDLSNSTVYASKNHCLRAESDGQTVRLSTENAYKVYVEIVSAGPGRLGKAPGEEPAAVLDYGDGSRVEFWSVKLVNSSTDREYGLFLRYTSQEGKTYAYDTDRVSLEKMAQYLRLLSNEPWEA